ncbi:MAG: hypothetical protein VX823_02050 [Actinomycetota bacterium]|nr:hypothetical protein [Actinomycetota bacterium]
MTEGDVEVGDSNKSDTPNVTEDDLRQSFERVTGEAADNAVTFRKPGLVIASIAVAGIVLVAFALGRRVGRTRSTIVEIVRV